MAAQYVTGSLYVVVRLATPSKTAIIVPENWVKDLNNAKLRNYKVNSNQKFLIYNQNIANTKPNIAHEPNFSAILLGEFEPLVPEACYKGHPLKFFDEKNYEDAVKYRNKLRHTLPPTYNERRINQKPIPDTSQPVQMPYPTRNTESTPSLPKPTSRTTSLKNSFTPLLKERQISRTMQILSTVKKAPIPNRNTSSIPTVRRLPLQYVNKTFCSKKSVKPTILPTRKGQSGKMRHFIKAKKVQSTDTQSISHNVEQTNDTTHAFLPDINIAMLEHPAISNTSMRGLTANIISSAPNNNSIQLNNSDINNRERNQMENEYADIKLEIPAQVQLNEEETAALEKIRNAKVTEENFEGDLTLSYSGEFPNPMEMNDILKFNDKLSGKIPFSDNITGDRNYVVKIGAETTVITIPKQIVDALINLNDKKTRDSDFIDTQFVHLLLIACLGKKGLTEENLTRAHVKFISNIFEFRIHNKFQKIKHLHKIIGGLLNRSTSNI